VLASSGDSGIRGNDDDCLYGDSGIGAANEERRNLLNKQKEKQLKTKSDEEASTEYSFVASFPASAPYVTAVGGTEGGLVQDDVADSTGETAWLYSGGGFSIYFDAPEWQTNAISNYFSSEDIEFPAESLMYRRDVHILICLPNLWIM